MGDNRDKIIIKTSIIGIIVNVFLAAFKAAIGLFAHSIAIVMDAVNNLSDALSSLITIIGTKLAAKKPDKKHPFGHGRVEYLSAMIISVIVLYAGVTSLTESVKKIIKPQTPDYAPVSLIIIAAAVLVKIFLGRYVKSVGKKVNSDALVASGTDASFDAIISASTLLAAIIFLGSGIKLEAWLGAVISLVIIKSGIDMLRETVSEILGERIDTDLAHSIKDCVTSFPQVRGAYDLVVHNYGPKQLVGSIHIEVPDTLTAEELDTLERQITHQVYMDTGVVMTGISIYSINEESEVVQEARNKIRDLVKQYPEVLELHGFYLNEAKKCIKFDTVISFDAKDRMAVSEEIRKKAQELYPDYDVQVTLDADISD